MFLKYETCKNGVYQTGEIEMSNEEFNKQINQEQKEIEMTVPAFLREQSSMEFMSKAQELLSFTVQTCRRIPKTYTFYGVLDAYNLARDILQCLVKANKLNLFKFSREREMLFEKSLGLLACLSVHLETLKPYIKLEDKKGKPRFTDNIWVRWGTLISDCIKLISGVMEKDKQRIEKENQRIEKEKLKK